MEKHVGTELTTEGARSTQKPKDKLEICWGHFWRYFGRPGREPKHVHFSSVFMFVWVRFFYAICIVLCSPSPPPPREALRFQRGPKASRRICLSLSLSDVFTPSRRQRRRGVRPRRPPPRPRVGRQSRARRAHASQLSRSEF